MSLPNRRIITPAEAIARARIAPRNAPPVRPSASIGGWLRWGLIDRAGHEVQGGEQHNLILNSFLDDFANAAFSETRLSHFAVGTGSAAPDVTDTALQAEVGRTTVSVDNALTRTANGVYEIMREREFDFGVGNGNLTEWGCAAGASAQMLVRELFRDELGDPVTVTKTSDFKLRLKYTLGITLTPVVPTAGSFTIANIGTVSGTYIIRAQTSGANADYHLFRLTAAAAHTSRAIVSSTTSQEYMGWMGLTNADVRTFSAYTTGTYTRAIDFARWETGTANHLIAQIGAGANNVPAFGFLIDEGDRFTKDDLHMLEIDNPVSLTWGRE